MKIDFITIKPDQTLKFSKCKTFGNKAYVTRKWHPEFVEGKCVFPSEFRRFFFWRQTRRFMFAIEGAEQCLEIEEGATKLKGSSWSMIELKDYIGKLVHLSMVKEKPFSNLQIYLILGLLGLIAVLQIMTMRGMRFG